MRRRAAATGAWTWRACPTACVSPRSTARGRSCCWRGARRPSRRTPGIATSTCRSSASVDWTTWTSTCTRRRSARRFSPARRSRSCSPRSRRPTRFPDGGQAPEYNTADATLWYVEAIRAYHAATGDDGLLKDLYPMLESILAWHRDGTRYGIRQDPADGLLAAGEPGVQLTWMDAKVGDWVVTPRIGKPVEINALWYNALVAMAGFARRLRRPAEELDTQAARVATGFERFWNRHDGWCFDVLDGPDGNETALRPKQILAVSLPASALPPARRRAVVH